MARASRLSGAQLRGLAGIAERRGSGTLRLTVWQNLILSDVPDAETTEAVVAIETLGLATDVSAIRSGLVACTGNAGCKFALADTKRHALALADHLDQRIALDQPINIHLTGCPNSCAQHYIGDIGLLGTKIEASEDGDQAEAYHINVGGGFGPQAQCGREIYRDIKAEDAPCTIERMLKAYLANRAAPTESFADFTRRYEVEALKTLFERQASE